LDIVHIEKLALLANPAFHQFQSRGDR